MSIAANIEKIEKEIGKGVQLVAVSKYSPDDAVLSAYDAGHRHFGENKAQDLSARYERLPKDIKWHFIGHLQRNKVKYIAPFIHLIHGVDSFKLLKEIDKQAKKNNRTISCLLQIHLAQESTKFGLSEAEFKAIVKNPDLDQLENITICGLMGMATNTDDMTIVEGEFKTLKKFFDQLSNLAHDRIQSDTLSMGMSQDYRLAIENGSNMVRIGTAVFKI